MLFLVFIGMGNEVTFIICVRVDEGKNYVEGSKCYDCSHCGTEIYVSPSSMNFMETETGVKLVCELCYKTNEGFERIRAEVLPESLEEIKKFMSGSLGRESRQDE